MPRLRRGFTLVELLVVIAVIGVLIAMLLPAMSRAKNVALQVSCASNMRQCIQVSLTYASDHRQFLPEGIPTSFDPAEFAYQAFQCTWLTTWDFRKAFRPSTNSRSTYITDWRIWGCPAADAPATINDPLNTRFACYGTYQYFAGTRGRYFNTTLPASVVPPLPPRRLTDKNNVSQYVLMQDVQQTAYGVSGSDSSYLFTHGTGQRTLPSPSDLPAYCLKRTVTPGSNPGVGADGINLGFYGGHVRWYAQSRLTRTGFNNATTLIQNGWVVSVLESNL